MNVKEQVLQAIQRLPSDINFRDVTDEIALLAAVQEAEREWRGASVFWRSADNCAPHKGTR